MLCLFLIRDMLFLWILYVIILCVAVLPAYLNIVHCPMDKVIIFRGVNGIHNVS